MFSVFVMYEDEYKKSDPVEQEYLDGLFDRLREHGVEVRWCEEQAQADELLIMTCNRARYDLWKQRGAAVFGFICSGYGDSYFPDSPVVVEGFAQIDVKFLERIYQRCHHLPWEIARTDRLVIRETVLDDLAVFETMYQEREAKRFLEPLYARGAENPPAYMEALERQYAFYGYGMWTVERIDGDERQVIGRAGIDSVADEWEQEKGTWGRLGYLIGAAYRGRGYADEACQAILRVAKEEFFFDGLYCVISEENDASFALARKLGVPVLLKQRQ